MYFCLLLNVTNSLKKSNPGRRIREVNLKDKGKRMKVQSISCSFDNYSYLLTCEQSSKAGVVDPTEAFPLLRELEKDKTELAVILCTHHHQDHIGGIAELLQQFPKAEVICHNTDKPRIGEATLGVEDGSLVSFGEQQGEVIYTPGHTRGSICYRFGEHLFVGDTLFGAGCGRLFEGDAQQMYSSLMDKLAVLPGDTSIYFGHEYTRKNLQFAQMVEPDNDEIAVRLGDLSENGQSTPTTLALEKKTNPFLRANSEGLRKNLEKMESLVLSSSFEVFTLLRTMRNDF